MMMMLIIVITTIIIMIIIIMLSIIIIIVTNLVIFDVTVDIIDEPIRVISIQNILITFEDKLEGRKTISARLKVSVGLSPCTLKPGKLVCVSTLTIVFLRFFFKSDFDMLGSTIKSGTH